MTTTPQPTSGPSSPARPGPSAGAAGAEGISLAARSMAHDAKNALNAIVLKVEILLARAGAAGGPGGAAEHHLAAIRDAARRLDALVRRFADFVDPPDEGSADAGAAASEAAALLGPEARRRGVELLVVPAPGGRARVSSAALNGLLLHLLGRALAATPPGGRVDVRAEERQGSVEIAVERRPVEAGGGPGASEQVAAEALGATLSVERDGTAERLRLSLPGAP
ncbi:MAG TPA: hypothetical protein VLS93_07470 [Anaeromyxobacteraceae bacterium]|nr:hypothetical protein [Anaeromyxobacteraceae bacterium]